MRAPLKNSFGLVFVLVALGVIMIVAAVYGTAGSSSAVHRFAVILNLPVGTVDGIPIGFREFDSLTTVLKDIEEGVTTAEIRKRVWEKLLEDVAIKQMAEDYGVTWADPDIVQYRTALLGLNADQQQDIRAAIAPLKLSFFDEKIVLPLLLRDRVNRALILSEENDDVTFINDVRAQSLVDPKAFVTLRDAYLAERNLANIEKTVVIPAEDLEAANMAFIQDLQVGDVTPIIAAPDGYRIYQIARYFEEPQEAWQLDELFVPSTIFSDTLATYKKSLSVKLYAKGYVSV